MNNYIIPVEKIKKAQLRYFDGNGTEIPEIKAYTIFIKKEDTYVNLFNFLADCNVYERLPYSNSTQSGEDYGNKIRLVCGKEEEGLCYVLESGKMEELRGLDNISIMDLYKVILKSEDFYFDRRDLVMAYPHLVSHRDKKRIMMQDDLLMDKLDDYIDEKVEEMENKKIYKK